MSLYTTVITAYAIGATIMLCLQFSRTHRKLLDTMFASGVSQTIGELANDAYCTKFRAWVFLLTLRARSCVDDIPVGESLLMYTYAYKLNSKGRAIFAPDTV